MLTDSKTHKQITGKEGEAAVCAWLLKEGFTIRICNFSVKNGEVDIIAHKGNILAFIEVKARYNNYFPLSEVITPSKQRKIIHAAKQYLLRSSEIDKVLRFDVALVTMGTTPTISYIANAFNTN
jgi:putative endonuclease